MYFQDSYCANEKVKQASKVVYFNQEEENCGGEDISGSARTGEKKRTQKEFCYVASL